MANSINRDKQTSAVATRPHPEFVKENYNGAEPCIHTLVEAQVEQSPHAIAAKFHDLTITYRELDERASQLARFLIARGAGPERVIGLCLERSLDMVVALLAILKSGGAYMSLDPGYPRERLELMIADARPAVIITTHGFLEVLPPHPRGVRVVCLDTERPSIFSQSTLSPASGVTPDDLAYLIYTSGSTGKPKGVAMPHRPLLNLLAWQLENWMPPNAATTLQFTSLNFDVAFQEIFCTLAAGGTLILTSEETRRDAAALLRLMREESVERIFLPFVALQQLAQAFDAERILPQSLREVITAGEQLQITPQIKALFHALGGCSLYNQYGPAETHVVTEFALRGNPDGWPLLPPIGKPVAGAQIHILDEHRRPVQEGETGEIYIGGPPLARGYLNRDDLTAERFIPDPFSSDEAARVYRTGDLGQMLPDGNIQYHGRSDHQIKIRGMRVEPGEIEAVMAQHPAVQQVVVTGQKIASGEKRLVAYYVPGAAPTAHTELRAFLMARLPAHFIPSAFVPLDAFPLTGTGKVDRLALPEPGPWRVEPNIVPPATPLEHELVAIWEKVLDLRPIGITDNFFDLGGHSLLAVSLAARIKEQFGVTLPLATIYKTPTVQLLAALLEKPEPALQASIVDDIRSTGSKAPFFCVGGFLDLARHLEPEQPFYGLSSALLAQIGDTRAAIPRIAEQCIAEIRSVQPRGPYYLGGHSLGGVIAFEMAQQLHAQGEEIALLAMLDPDPPRPSLATSCARRLDLAAYALRELLRAGPEGWSQYLLQILTKLKTRAAFKLKAWYGFSAMSVTEKTNALEGAYGAKPYAGRVTLVLAMERQVEYKPVADPRLDWGKVAAKGFQVHEVPGDHASFLREPAVRLVAEALQPYFSSPAE